MSLATEPESGAQTRQPNHKLFLRFSVQDTQCCVPLSDVERVLPLMALRRVPTGPDYLAGLLNLHGTSVPVIDAGLRIGLDLPESYDENTPVLLCAHRERRLGLIVSNVLGAVSVNDDDLQMRSELAGIKAPLIAVIESGEQLCLVLDLLAIMEADVFAHGPATLTGSPV